MCVAKMLLFVKRFVEKTNHDPVLKTYNLCLIAKDQKEFLHAKRLNSKVCINSWSLCGVARAEFART